MRDALQRALAFERLDVVLGRAVPGKTQGIGNLAQGGRAAALGHMLADVVQHPALVLGELEFVHTY